MRSSRGFTLVEMLSTVAVIALVTAISVPAYTHYIHEGRKAREISAARKLVSAYLTAAADNDGYLLPGYDRPDAVASDHRGDSIHFPASARYAWRLAPYLNYDMSAILFNGNEHALDDSGVDGHYAVSVASNLGINATFVGGDYGSASDLVPSPANEARFGNFCVTRLAHASHPSSLIVFVSARRSEKEIGRFAVQSPYFRGRRWTGNWNEKAPASSFGFVDLRYNGRAVAAMLDGHVEMLDENQLTDMRRWSNQAAEFDDPKFTIKRIQ